jgi:hypothetical protein
MDNDTPKTSKLPTLYRAIIEQNSSWKDKKVQTSWGVDMSTGNAGFKRKHGNMYVRAITKF